MLLLCNSFISIALSVLVITYSQSRHVAIKNTCSNSDYRNFIRKNFTRILKKTISNILEMLVHVCACTSFFFFMRKSEREERRVEALADRSFHRGFSLSKLPCTSIVSRRNRFFFLAFSLAPAETVYSRVICHEGARRRIAEDDSPASSSLLSDWACSAYRNYLPRRETLFHEHETRVSPISPLFLILAVIFNKLK